MRSLSVLLVLALALTAAGCAKKTATEQLRDDMKKAARELDRELKSL